MAEPMERCRIYLVIPSDAEAEIAGELENIVQRTDVACVLQRIPGSGFYDQNIARHMMEICHSNDVSFLLEDDISTLRAIGADGIHISRDFASENNALEAISECLKLDASIGIHCGTSRHEAMVYGEAGAHYIAFGEDNAFEQAAEKQREIIGWWAELFEIPCVAWNVKSIDEAEKLAKFGADFVAIDPLIWREVENPVDFLTILDKSLNTANRAA